MARVRSTYPSAEVLWRGAILGGIVNAVKTAENALFSAFSYWSRNHYTLDGMDGRRGCISFAGGHWLPGAPLVGVFSAVRRRPKKELPTSEWIKIGLKGATPYHIDLAMQDSLAFLELDESDKGIIQSATTAFWDSKGKLIGADKWSTVLNNGAELIERELIADLDVAMDRWQESFDLSNDQLSIVNDLFGQKIAHPAARRVLSRSEVRRLRSHSDKSKGLKLCCESLMQLDIVVEG